jgi:uncharacterized protein
MDEASGLCRGCHRTLDEIARWSVMNEAEKRRVVTMLAQRKQHQKGSDPCG